MNSSSNNSLISDNALDNTFSSKLRRLKIQENALTSNLNKCFLLNADENDRKIKYDYDNIQLKKYFSKLKDKFREIKHLFEDVTLKTNDQNLEKSDIDELKRDILELETKIRTAKQFLASELQNLRNEELAITKKQETSETLLYFEERRVKRRNLPQIKGYKEIIPSPVRAMIHSPFKCLEVQQFQDFMKNSLNRYGGWNEYNHNIFVQIWNKYYGDNNMMTVVKSIEDTFSYQDFKNEVLHKIPGSSLESINLHSRWYFEYLNLKMKQQKALNKWKENRRKIKPTRKVLSFEIDESTLEKLKSPVNTKLCRKQNNGNVEVGNINNRRNLISSDTKTTECNIIHSNKKVTSPDEKTKESTGSYSAEDQNLGKKIDLSRLLKPTKQWLIKQEYEKETHELNKGVETIAKLRIPTWRLNLSK